MHPGFDETDTLTLFGAQVVAFVILAKRPDVHIEDGTIQVARGVLFGNHGILDGIHAADRRAVAVAAAVGIPGADALEPGNLLRFLLIGGAHQVSHGRPGGTEDPLEFEAADHIGIGLVLVVFGQRRGVIRLAAGCQNDGPDGQVPFHGLLIVVDGFGQADFHALVALGADPAAKAAIGLLFGFVLVVSEGYFQKVALPGFRIETAHRNPGLVGFARDVRLFEQPLFLPALCQIRTVDEAVNALRSGFSAGHRIHD